LRALKKKILMVFVFVGIVLGAYLYLYGNHRDISKETPKYEFTASDLLNAFEIDVSAANALYLNQPVLVQGQITEIEYQALGLDHNVYVSFDKEIDADTKQGNVISVKGRCIGYDELFGLVKIDQAVILE
jgi:hypothetical protein